MTDHTKLSRRTLLKGFALFRCNTEQRRTASDELVGFAALGSTLFGNFPGYKFL